MAFLRHGFLGPPTDTEASVTGKYIDTLEQLVHSKDTIIEQQEEIIRQQKATITRLEGMLAEPSQANPGKRKRRVVDYSEGSGAGDSPEPNPEGLIPWTLLLRRYNPNYPNPSLPTHSVFVAKYFEAQSLNSRMKSGPTKNYTRAVPERLHEHFIQAFTQRFPEYRSLKSDPH